MPAIPLYQQRTNAPGALQLANVDPNAATAGAQALAGLGETIGRAAPAVADIVDRVTISNNAWQMAQKTAQTLGELEDFRGQLSADEDYDSHSAKYLEKAKEIEDRVAGELPGNLNRIWRQDFRRVSLANSVSVAAEAQKLKAGKVRAELGNTLLALSELTGLDPATDDAARAQASLAVNASAAAGNLSFAERNELLTKFNQDSVEASIRRDVLANPELAERKLAAGEYKGLSGEAQAVWAQRISTAAESEQRRVLTAENQAYTRLERAKKEAADAAAKQGDHLFSTGGLTPDWIEQNRDTLDPADYRYFYGQLRGGPGAPRDPFLYSDLRLRAGRGEDVRNDAREALRNGAIQTGDFDRIVGEVEQQRPGWYRRGSEYITTMSGYSDLNPTPAAAADKATMLDQWNDWAGAHPGSSEREAQVAYQDIVSHNALVKISALPLPKLTVGTRLQMDIDATEKETVKAFQEGKIDRQEFERQAQILKDWRNALAPTQQKQAPK